MTELNSKNDSIHVTPSHEQVDIGRLLSIIWRYKFILISTVLVFSITTVVWSLSLPNIYRAKVVLIPGEDQQGGLGGLASSLDGLAGLAGVNLGQGGKDKVKISLEIAKSRKFIGDFVDKYNLYPELLAAKSWSESDNRLILDSAIYNENDDTWHRAPVGRRLAKPSRQEAYEVFLDVFFIEDDSALGTISLSFDSLSPFRAKELVDLFVIELNEVIKKRDIKEAKDRLAYLRKHMEKNSIRELQDVFYQLIEEQLKTLMLAEVSPEYVVKTIDPAVVPELKSSPQRSLLVVLGAFGGGIVGLLLIFLFHFYTVTVRKVF